MVSLHKHFTSSQELHAWASDCLEAGHRVRCSRGWDGDGHGFQRGMRTLRDGDESNMDKASAMLDEFQENIEVYKQEWRHDIVGAFPDVPAYISGDPECMWSMAPILSDRSPLRIFVGLTSSAAVEAEDLAKRGITLAAFAMALINKRPVYITPYVNLGTHGNHQNAIISWDVQTSPLVLSELLGCLSTPSVTRYLGIEACYMLNPRVTGAWHDDAFDEAKMREHLGASPDDLYLPSIHLSDPLLRNPKQWIKDNLAKYGADDE